MRKTWVASWMLVAGLALAGCSQKTEDFGKAAQDYAVHFQERVDRGEFGTLYAESAPRMKTQTAEADFIGVLRQVREAMGERKRTTLQRTEPAEAADGAPLSRLIYDTEFANGTGVESFYFDNVDGKPRLFHYNIESPVLLDLAASMDAATFEDPFGRAMLASITRFHDQVDADDYGSIYDAGAPDMQQSITREDFIDGVRRAQSALGKRGQSAPHRRATTQATSGIPLVAVEMRSEFANDTAIERFYFQNADNQPLLYRYEIESELAAKAMQAGVNAVR